MTDTAFLPAHELAARIRRGELSAVALLQLYLDRIARLDPQINAVPVLDAERAMLRAEAADAALARGENWGPLHGVAMTVKEAFNVTGLPTTYGLEAFRDNIARSDALTVQRLQAAGAVIFGKTNVPASLADWQSFNPVYGTTNNPWDLTRTPGGSSGGSAAALAAGFTALELGSDIGASIRNPAHYCGVWGHKPTWGVVPLAGHELRPRECADNFDIAVAGPLARSAFDLALAMDVLCAPLSAMTPLGRVPLAWQDRGTPPRRARVAMLFDDAEAEVDHSVQRALHRLTDFLRSQGVVVTEGLRPVDSAEANDVYTHLLRAATGAHYDAATYDQAQQRARGYAAGDSSHPARHYRGNTMTQRDWVQFNERRMRLQRQWAAFFEQHDLLICPVATTPAFQHNPQGERWDRMIPVNGHTQPSTDALFWAGYPGVVGLPATAVPLGLSDDGLPIGAQIIGPLFADPDCLRFAQWLECEYRAFVAPPLASAVGSA
ncbi:MAG: amidase [Rubrivivax sp.]|nr:amidase [Rubrivivax sp.]